MGLCLNLPTLEIDFLKVFALEFDVLGAGFEGGRNMLGESISIAMAGGGLVAGSYSFIVHSPEQIEYVNMLGARLNGSFRFINLPIRTDFAGAFPVIGGVTSPVVGGIPHSDGSLFSDDSGYSQGTVFGGFAANAALNAGQVTIDIFGATRKLRWSDWFSVYHAERKGWRAYRYWQASEPSTVSVVVDGVLLSGQRYTLSIGPTLRAAVSAGERIEFARPRFVAKFPADFTLPWREDLLHMDRPAVSFVEAF